MSGQSITSTGGAALWVGFAFMFASMLAFTVYTYKSKSAYATKYNYLTTGVVSIASLAYLTMALGGTTITIPGNRDFLWIRYADWAATTPLLLIDLGLLAGAAHIEIAMVVLADLLMVAAGFAGAVSYGTNAAWPLFIFGMVAFVPVLHALGVTFRASAAKRGPATAKLYNTLSIMMVVLWSGYPLIWATGEGGQVSTVDQETIAYAIFDITAKCVFGAILIFSHSGKVEEEEVAALEDHRANPAAAPLAQGY